jgi:hypothetical protein
MGNPVAHVVSRAFSSDQNEHGVKIHRLARWLRSLTISDLTACFAGVDLSSNHQGKVNPHDPTVTHTPNLDRLYAESSHLTRYCSGPLCSPARAGLMTGRYHLRTCVLDTYGGRSTLDPTEWTLAQALQGAGYHTGAFGKWHLGDNYPSRAISVNPVEDLVAVGSTVIVHILVDLFQGHVYLVGDGANGIGRLSG